MEETRIFRLHDGRTLQVRVSGPSEGPLLVYHHGIPDGAARVRCLEGPAHARGWRFVSIARPGYGDSSGRPGRCVVDVVEDTDAVLDDLDASSCVVVGWSGGGPHALACAARLERATAALVVSGLAPLDAEGLEFMAGMGQEILMGFELAIEGEDAIRSVLEARVASRRRVPKEATPPPVARTPVRVDQAVRATQFAEDMADAFQEGTRTGVDGWVEDMRALVRPWGFDVGEIERPVSLWHGTQDPVAPVTHGRWLAAHVPGVRAHILEGEGHHSVVVSGIDEMLDELATLARP